MKRLIRKPVFVFCLAVAFAPCNARSHAQEELPAPLLAPPLLEPATSETSLLEAPQPTLAGEETSPEPALRVLPGHHPWARFEPGAWRRLRETNETFDRQGVFVGRSVSERVETLLRVEGQRYVLRVESVTDVAGKRLPGAIQEIALSMLNDRADLSIQTRLAESTTLNLAGRATPCDRWELSSPLEAGVYEESLYYSAEAFPHFLKRVLRVRRDDSVAEESDWLVTRVGEPVLLAGSLHPGWSVSESTLEAGGLAQRWSLHTLQAPGGLVRKREVLTNTSGERVRWSVTELVEAGLEPGVASIGPGVAEPTTIEIDLQNLRPRRLLRSLRRGAPPEGADLEEEP